MLALLVGQSVAIVVAVALLPAAERWLAPLVAGRVGAVAGYGSWRAAQQFLRPGMLTAMRLLVVGVAGLATMGALEAARIYTAPMLLVVSGAARSCSPPTPPATARQSRALLRRADRGVLGLFGGTVAMSVVAVAGHGRRRTAADPGDSILLRSPR